MEDYKAVIAYDGTDFLGFQIQAQGRSVQGTLEETLAKIAKTPVRVVGSGRTDTGVHASGQVIAFSLPWRHQAADLQRALNVNLPRDVVIRQLTNAQPGFHPRFDARRRQYRYTILNQPLRDVFKDRYTAWIKEPLAVLPMQQAAQHLLGTQDFASFGRPPQGENTVRTIFKAEWSVNGSELVFEIEANAFLYRMVRNIVGTLIRVGRGEMEPGRIRDILLAKDRAWSEAPAQPAGLCLINVNYLDD